MTPSDADKPQNQPLIIHSRVTPWGFLVALPLALAFAYVGALTLDHPILPTVVEPFGEIPFWVASVVLIGFAMMLFLVGVSELAAYMQPSVEVMMDHERVTTWGVMGERRFAWQDITGAEIGEGQLILRGRGRQRGKSREMRLHFNRLQIAPSLLIGRVLVHRPDIKLHYAFPWV